MREARVCVIVSARRMQLAQAKRNEKKERKGEKRDAEGETNMQHATITLQHARSSNSAPHGVATREREREKSKNEKQTRPLLRVAFSAVAVLCT